ncbi:MAG: divalent metal cation transporter [Bacteroidota bacterium]
MFAIKKRISSILLWSVISAAFIGPGTLAASSAAGASYKYSLIWSLVFATVACLILQEMAARISIVTGSDLSKILKQNLNPFPAFLIGFAVIVGCAAYEAGNILGALSGFSVLIPADRFLLISAIGAGAIVLLALGGKSVIIRVLGFLVALMGAGFVIVALKSSPSLSQILSGTIPSIPEGSEWLTLALIGTTIVPYNIYLGSGLSKGQTLKEMRVGLAISIVFGGFISIAILIAATQINSMNSFLDMARLMGNSLGDWAYLLLGAGLFAAGFTSTVTAPMAAGIITEGLFAKHEFSLRWYKTGWLAVLSVGLLFGFLDVKPIPVIVAAQALNGFILPLLGIILVITANDFQTMQDKVNSTFLNVMAFVVLEVLLLLGLNSLWNVIDQVTYLPDDGAWKFIILQSIGLVILLYTGFLVYRKRKLKTRAGSL